MQKINVAIVGLGRIASLLEEDSLREKPCTHAGAITANADCGLAAGCDIDEERRNLFTRKWQVPVYADAAEMLRVHKPQILTIATHPDSHYHYCRLAADLGVKAVICEKPLAGNIREARKITRLAENGPVIITNHERRYAEDYIRAKAILNSGKLGGLLSARAVLYMGRTQRLLDVLWHDGTHLADAIMFLTGMSLKHKKRWGAKLSANAGTAWLEAELGTRGQGLGTRDRCLLSKREKNTQCLQTKTPVPSPQSPVPIIIEIGAGRDHLVFEMEFSCEKGRLRIGNGVFEVWESVPSPYAEKFRSLRQTDETFSGPTGYFANMVKDAVACVKEPGRLPRSSAADGLRVIEYLNSIKAWG
ncbi:MAG: Gfo/Idh/MocA family oxidoreductase [Treponema sp.]|jgi:predicted dehydrogenase|nr:Gfo/Idh/MocA family oxidoreductase [Treponema sp.]